MGYVKISEEEMRKTRKIYDEVLSGTASALLFNVGYVIGGEIARKAGDKKDFFKKASEILKERGWVKDITFEKKKVNIVKPAEGDKCDRLRGIITAVYERHYNQKAYCTKIKGNVFRIEFLGG